MYNPAAPPNPATTFQGWRGAILGLGTSVPERVQIPAKLTPFRAIDFARWRGMKKVRCGIMAVISMKACWRSSVHFGHRAPKQMPRMKPPYIFADGMGFISLTTTNGPSCWIKVITLSATQLPATAHDSLRRHHCQAQETIAEGRRAAACPTITERWMGGMLTNWSTMHQRAFREAERLEETCATAARINNLTRRRLADQTPDHACSQLSGVRNMKRHPICFSSSTSNEESADARSQPA